MLRDEIQRGDAAGVEERRVWFVERLGKMENEAGESVERGSTACVVQVREEDEEWMRGWKGDGAHC